MKKGILMLAACLTTMTAAAQYSEDGQDFEEENYRESHTFLDNVYTGGGWKANWFLSVKGGMSAFAGNPVGHGDLCDAVMMSPDQLLMENRDLFESPLRKYIFE